MDRMNLSNSEVSVTQLSDRMWRTDKPIDYLVFEKLIIVPPNFKTDFASVPRALWAVFPPYGEYTAAAIVHDYLYHKQDIAGAPITRSFADQVFLQGMKDLGVRWSRRRTMWMAVRAWGWLPWRNRTVTEQQR